MSLRWASPLVGQIRTCALLWQHYKQPHGVHGHPRQRVAFRGTPGEMQITQKVPVKVCYKSSTLSGVYNSITFSEQSPGSVCRGEHSAIHKLYFPLCKAHTRAPSEARWMENTQSALNIARTLSQVSAFSVSETTVVIFIYNGVCVGVSAAALWSGNSSWLRAASGRWKEQHDLVLRLECAFLFILFFFLSSFRRLGHGRSISANYVPWVLDGRLWVKHVSTSVAALSPRDKIWGDKLGGEKAENGVGSDTSCFRTPLISWPMKIPRANEGGGKCSELK